MAIGIFSLLAVATSFIGTTLAMSESAMEQLSLLFRPQNQEANQESRTSETGHRASPPWGDPLSIYCDKQNPHLVRIAAYSGVLIPPLFIAVSAPALFFPATQIAVRIPTCFVD